jgi:hypothetical protein
MFIFKNAFEVFVSDLEQIMSENEKSQQKTNCSFTIFKVIENQYIKN